MNESLKLSEEPKWFQLFQILIDYAEQFLWLLVLLLPKNFTLKEHRLLFKFRCELLDLRRNVLFRHCEKYVSCVQEGQGIHSYMLPTSMVVDKRGVTIGSETDLKIVFT